MNAEPYTDVVVVPIPPVIGQLSLVGIRFRTIIDKSRRECETVSMCGSTRTDVLSLPYIY